MTAAAAGGDHNLALRSGGSVASWGSNECGQLGNGDNANRTTWAEVHGLTAGSGVVAIAAGAQHSLALRSDGSVLAWGHNSSGQLGDGGANTDQLLPVQSRT